MDVLDETHANETEGSKKSSVAMRAAINGRQLKSGNVMSEDTTR